MLSVHEKNGLQCHEMGLGFLFPTNPDLDDILGDTDFKFENLYFCIVLDPRFLDFQIPGFPDSSLSSSYICPGW